MSHNHFDLIDRLCARRCQDIGLKTHGLLDLNTDPRDFKAELCDELLDAINYTNWAMARGEILQDVGQGIVWCLKNILWCHVLPKNYQDNGIIDGKPA